jgi:hypothetical protein
MLQLRTLLLSPQSAPTGSGKTVLFELAMIQMLTNSSGGGTAEKCVYVAPTKVCLLVSFGIYPLKGRRHCALKGLGTGQTNLDISV